MGWHTREGSRARVILEGPNGILIEQTTKLAFKARNNQVKYEALIAEMLLAKELGVQRLLAKSDSLLVIEQVIGEYQANDPQLASYLRYVKILIAAFSAFDLVHVPENKILERTCCLSWLAREKEVDRGR